MATVIITGGGGFLGQCLASCLLEKGSVEGSDGGTHPLEKLILADIAFPPVLQPTIEASSYSEIVHKVPGDVSDRGYCRSLFDEISPDTKHVSIFHLGAVMSGDGERAPTDYVTKEDTISDSTRATPHTTYGATKACAELLLSDYARRGFVDGRGIRLPTIIVRAGAPNAATTSCFSGVVREPLAGIDVELPIAPDVPHAVTGKRAVMQAMMLLHNLPLGKIEAVLGFDRTVFLPAVALSLGDLEKGLKNVVSPDSHSKLGKIQYKVDDFLSNVVGGFPTKIDAHRAIQLGIPPAPSAETLVREYAADFPSALADGITLIEEVVMEESPLKKQKSENMVAVITGGGSGIGRAVAQRLSKGGWTIVLAGRRKDKLEETRASLEKEYQGEKQCLIVPTDVSEENQVVALFQAADQKYGRVDLLFNNAGINSAAASLEHVTVEDFERVLKINVTGPFLCAREAMRIMSRNGGGRIINNGSISAHVPRPGSVCYTSSKHAILGLTKCIALDGRKHNVACGQIDFGNVVSELSCATNTAAGATQANGTLLVEPTMSLENAAETFWAMVNLPLGTNILNMTVMATNMPFVGRG
eukprot:scaffold61089_cov59-Attheya_sp.AAC.7